MNPSAYSHVPFGAGYVQAPSGLLLPGAVAEQRARETCRPKAMDFFCGAGGFTLGVIQAGFEVVAGVENDPTAVWTYMTNLCRWGRVEIHYAEPGDKDRLNRVIENGFKRAAKRSAGGIQRPGFAGSGWISHEPDSIPGVSHIFFGDVRKFTPERMLSDLGMKRGDLDLVVGGPPCQGFSHSGKRDVMDPRSSLVFEYAHYIVGLNPKTFCMENVVGIATMLTPEGQPVLDKFCRIIEDGGVATYDALQRVLKARPDVAGLMRSKPVNDRDRKPKTKSRIPSDTPDLFAAE